ncbi:hypothetical protein BS50DRAFT_677047 [Corynespora cassiicola Philippines]|uniref:F-box domain-containing protein n=1 Tax=Corynespora cassiicola Philippines TaxID=1448308 RepID=A0A2T2NQ15_CORCC|nr:hypothetical protein BS50DRAFT_677047 [Corynespora cassiicola Philippines]
MAAQSDTLFNLPAELVQKVFSYLDPESFYLCLRTSELFRLHALYPGLLREQLSRVPGHRDLSAPEFQDAESLLTEFMRRCEAHLYNGSSRIADVCTWDVNPQASRKISRIINLNRTHDDEKDYEPIKKSGMVPQTQLNDFNPLIFVEVIPKHTTVNVYEIMEEQSRWTPKLRHTIVPSMLSHILPGVSESQTYQVLQVAANWHKDKPYLAVAYRRSQRDPVATTKVVVFGFSPRFGPLIKTSFDLDTNVYDEVLAIGLTRNLELLASTWAPCHPSGKGNSSYPEAAKARRCHNVEDPVTLEIRTMEHVQQLYEHYGYRFTRIEVGSKRWSLLPEHIPHPKWTASITSEPQRDFVYREFPDMNLPADFGTGCERRFIGRPIAQFHEHRHPDLRRNYNPRRNNRRACTNIILTLVITTPYTHPRYNPSPVACRSGAFLLKASYSAFRSPTTCYPTDPYIMSEAWHMYTPVARLDGIPDLDNLCTEGLKIAVSPLCTRIAIAHWRSVLIYAINPEAFLRPEVGTAGKGRHDTDEDKCYRRRCGWEYHGNLPVWENECVVLPPIQLPEVKGVVFDLEFRTEDEVWAWGEAGLSRWEFAGDIWTEREEKVLPASLWDD